MTKGKIDTDRLFALCGELADEYPDARVVEIALTFEDGSKLTFSQDERIREAMEAHRHEYD